MKGKDIVDAHANEKEYEGFFRRGGHSTGDYSWHVEPPEGMLM
jgi:hypothetical protein